MAVSINPHATKTFVLKCDVDLPEEQQTKFQLRTLTAEQKMSLANCTRGMADMQLGSMMQLTIKAGLAGWSNLRDADGKEVEAKKLGGNTTFMGCRIRDAITDDSLNCLRAEWLQELFAAITDFNKLNEDDAKN